eukprot:gene264-887_t
MLPSKHIVKEGCLIKSPPFGRNKKGFLKRWKQRHFILFNPTDQEERALYYFKNKEHYEQGEKWKGQILLSDCVDLRVQESALFKRNFLVSLTTCESSAHKGRVFHFVAEDAITQREWFEALNTVWNQCDTREPGELHEIEELISDRRTSQQPKRPTELQLKVEQQFQLLRNRSPTKKSPTEGEDYDDNRNSQYGSPLEDSGYFQKGSFASQSSPRESMASGSSQRDSLASGSSQRDSLASGSSQRDSLASGWSPRDSMASGWSHKDSMTSGKSSRDSGVLCQRVFHSPGGGMSLRNSAINSDIFEFKEFSGPRMTKKSQSLSNILDGTTMNNGNNEQWNNADGESDQRSHRTHSDPAPTTRPVDKEEATSRVADNESHASPEKENHLPLRSPVRKASNGARPMQALEEEHSDH